MIRIGDVRIVRDNAPGTNRQGLKFIVKRMVQTEMRWHYQVLWQDGATTWPENGWIERHTVEA